ncbi:MAG: ABC transporter permease, partial [Candidatus Methylomirabilales bacterium]
MIANLRELYAYRTLIWSLVVRDLKARYRGSILGFLWTFLNPLLLMATYTLVFSVYIRIEMEKYTAFLLVGLLPWIWFSSSLLMGSTSIVEGGSLIKKVFFPPQVLPTVTVL